MLFHFKALGSMPVATNAGSMGERVTFLVSVLWTKKTLEQTFLVLFCHVNELNPWMYIHNCRLRLLSSLLYLKQHTGVGISPSFLSGFFILLLPCSRVRVSSIKAGNVFFNLFTGIFLVFCRYWMNTYGMKDKVYSLRNLPCSTQKCLEMDQPSRYLLCSGI